MNVEEEGNLRRKRRRERDSQQQHGYDTEDSSPFFVLAQSENFRRRKWTRGRVKVRRFVGEGAHPRKGLIRFLPHKVGGEVQTGYKMGEGAAMSIPREVLLRSQGLEAWHKKRDGRREVEPFPYGGIREVKVAFPRANSQGP